MHLVKRIAQGAARPQVVLATIGVTLIAAPTAIAVGEGKELEGGKRNPSNNSSQAYSAETEIIADNSTYGTRQSNKSTTGGGAIYGCRAVLGKNPCLRANNLNKGLAFTFQSSGNIVGSITTSRPGDKSKPFITTATGVATGLNADRVDGMDGKEIASKAEVGESKFAVVSADGKLGNKRNATAASVQPDPAAEGNFVYFVTVDEDVSECGFTANPQGNPMPNALGVSAHPEHKNVVQVKSTEQVGFHLQVTC